MKQQYEGLELTAHNRLTGDNKITTENLLNKDNTHLVKQMNENWERILKATKEEFEKTQTITEHVLEEKRKEITLIKGILVFEKKVSYENVLCLTLNYYFISVIRRRSLIFQTQIRHNFLR